MIDPFPPSAVSIDDESDQELVARVRDGDSRAYAALWTRHSGPAYGVARTFTTLDADDLVAEAFLKVLEAIRSGGGPIGAFRPYITMAVRNLGRSLYVREPLMLDGDFDRRGTEHLSGEVVAVIEFERSTTLEAFQSLPPRWQEVLWYSEVDGLKVGVIGNYLGVPANAVSALLIRARRGLREAWISAQLARARTPECAPVIRELGGYVRDALSARTRSKVDAHLATCDSCTAALAEARRTSSQLALVLLPAVAGTAGAAGYAASATAPAMPQALLAMGEGSVADEPPVGPSPRTRRRRVLIGSLVLVLLLGGGGVAIVLAQSESPVPVADVAPVVSPTPSSSAPETRAPSSPAAPTPDPGPSPDATPGDPSEQAATSPSPVPGTAVPSSPPAAPPRGSTVPQPEAPVSPGSPAAPAVPSGLDAPGAQLAQPDPRMYPRVSGSDAWPGAMIELLDESGAIVGTSTVGRDGSWQAAIVSGSSGAHEVRARQTVGEVISPLGAAMAFTTSPAPTISAPLVGAVVDASRFSFSFDAPGGTIVQRQIVDVTPVQTLRVPGSGVWNERLAVAPGQHVMRVRHANPATGDVGPYAEIAFTAR